MFEHKKCIYRLVRLVLRGGMIVSVGWGREVELISRNEVCRTDYELGSSQRMQLSYGDKVVNGWAITVLSVMT